MIIPMLCVTIFVILVVWFLLPRVARLMIHTPTAISIFVCLSMVQLMAVFIDRKSGSAGMPRPISYAVFCLKKKNNIDLAVAQAKRAAQIRLLHVATRDCFVVFFVADAATTEIYTLSLHDALPILTIFVILVVWFLLPRVARLMIHTPTAISIFVCLSMVQLMAVFISMRCTLCGHFLQVALTLILVVGYAIAAS